MIILDEKLIIPRAQIERETLSLIYPAYANFCSAAYLSGTVVDLPTFDEYCTYPDIVSWILKISEMLQKAYTSVGWKVHS